MATIREHLNNHVFPSELAHLTILGATGDFEFVLTVRGTPLYENIYTPDSGGVCHIDGLSSLLIDYCRSDQERNLPVVEIKLKDGDPHTYTCTLIPCRSDLAVNAETFIGTSFLTMAGSRKKTHLAAKEYLYWIPPAGSEPTETGEVTAYWLEPDGRIDIRPQVGTKIYDDFDMYGIDVSPGKLTPHSPDDVLLQYKVSVGLRELTFVLPPPNELLSPMKDFRFQNAFFLPDTFHCSGVAEEDAKVEYQSARIAGDLKNFRIESNPSWTVKTGPLLPKETNLFQDFATSAEVQLEDGTSVTLTSSEFKKSDRWTAMPEGQFTYRQSATLHRCILSVPANTFDSTFDETYR